MVKGVAEERTTAETMAARPPARIAIVLGLATVYLVWGSTYLAMKVAVETLPPFLMAGTRFIIAGTIAYGWVDWHGAARPSRREIIDAIIGGALMLLGGNGAVVWAVYEKVPTGLAALVVATVPLWIALLDWFRPHGSRPNVRTLLSLVLGLAGVGWLIVPKQQASTEVPLFGGCLLLFSALSWSIGSLYIRARAAVHKTPFLKTAALQMLAGGLLLLAAGLCAGEFATFDGSRAEAISGQAATAEEGLSPQVKSLLAMSYLIVAGSLLSYTVHGWLLTVVRPTLVATYAFVNPIVAVLLGCVFANEKLSGQMLLSGGMVVAAVAVMVLARPTTKSTSTESEH